MRKSHSANRVLNSFLHYENHGTVHGSLGIELRDTIIVGASGATLQTAEGRELIDFSSGAFGYAHPGVHAAVSAQMRILPQSSRMFLNRPLARLVSRVAQIAPGDLTVMYPCNSATEGVEGALKLAKGYHRRSSRNGFVATTGSDHGNTLGAMSISGANRIKPARAGFDPADVRFVPFGDAMSLRRAVESVRPAGIVLEPAACGDGLRLAPPGYLAAVREICSEAGALLIVNENATGLGRTGRMFAVDHERVVPDVLVLGGALGGGAVPAGGYVTTHEINWRVYGRRGPWMHGSATGGNPIACAATMAVFDALEEEDIPNRCRVNGDRVLAALRVLGAAHPHLIGEVVGFGQLAAIRWHDNRIAHIVAKRALEEGVLLRLDGHDQRWIGVRPPLICSTEEVDRGLAGLERALNLVSEECSA